MAIAIRTISIPKQISDACDLYADANHLSISKTWFSNFVTIAIKEKLQKEGFWEPNKPPPFPVSSNDDAIHQNGIDDNTISESSEDSAEILPCPFCGNQPLTITTKTIPAGYSLRCECAKIRTPHFSTMESAVANWNGLVESINNAKSFNDVNGVRHLMTRDLSLREYRQLHPTVNGGVQ